MKTTYQSADFTKLKDLYQDGNSDNTKDKKKVTDQELIDRTNQWKDSSSKLTAEIKKL